MIVGGYTADFYCDDPRHTNEYRRSIGRAEISLDLQVVGETYAECARQARKRGWRLSYDRQTAICPAHNRNHADK